MLPLLGHTLLPGVTFSNSTHHGTDQWPTCSQYLFTESILGQFESPSQVLPLPECLGQLVLQIL